MGEFTKHLQLFYMFPLRWGVCIPSPCSESDLSNITAQGMISVYQLHLLNMRDFQFYKHFQGQVKTTLIHVYLKRIFICSFFFLVSKRFMEINITVPRCEIREPVTIENYQIPIL